MCYDFGISARRDECLWRLAVKPLKSLGIMERNLFRYIWSHTRNEQIWIIFITILAMVPFYLSFDVPKQIINGPITGIGFDEEGATLPFMRIALDLPFIGQVVLSDGTELERLPLLFALCFAFLCLVIVNGVIKIYVNTFKGRMGERVLRRLRYSLMDRVLRFPPKRFKSVKAGEVSSMVKDEVEPFGGFSGEAFASPVMLSGQALTAMLFIFVQHPGLGLVALVMALVQVLVIPRLRVRLVELGRQRQLNARRLAGRAAEIVDGIDTIHATDTSNYVRADLVDRLGKIFKIRYDFYQWKFFVKFLNNFIAQMTPFIFYSFGGYLAITGRLDVGQLVAVIAAYKELPGPMKGLIDWDMARQDIQVKYEAVVSQFDVEPMIESALHEVDPAPPALAGKPLQIKALGLTDDGGTSTLRRVSAQFDAGETVCFVGPAGSGAAETATALGRLIWPAEGAILIGDDNLLQMPEAQSGRRVTYCAPDAFFFAGTLGDNLLFGLKNAPQEAADYHGKEAEFQKWWWREAELTGNPVLDLNAGWIDEAALLDHTRTGTINEAIDTVLGMVEVRDDILQLALKCPLDPETDAGLAQALVGARAAFFEELATRGWENLVLGFDPSAYNDEATIAENLYFGNLDSEETFQELVAATFMRTIAQETGLVDALYDAGRTIGETATRLLYDLPLEHPFFERMTLFPPKDLMEYRQILARTEGRGHDAISPEDRFRILSLCAGYSEPWYRFGILTDRLKSIILDARARIREEIPDDLAERIEFYDPARYMFRSDVRENIVFGTVNSRIIDADARVAEVGAALRERFPDMLDRVMQLGLRFDVGPGGRRLSSMVKSKLNLARALLRSSDIYVFNQPLLGIDRDQQARIIETVLQFLRGGQDRPLVIWVLSEPSHSRTFPRVVSFEDGRIVEDHVRGTHETKPGRGDHAPPEPT